MNGKNLEGLHQYDFPVKYRSYFAATSSSVGSGSDPFLTTLLNSFATEDKPRNNTINKKDFLTGLT